MVVDMACSGWKRSGPGPMVYVIAPTGRILETHPIPSDRPTNCTFGDSDLTTLYVTTGQRQLFRARNTGHQELNRSQPA